MTAKRVLMRSRARAPLLLHHWLSRVSSYGGRGLAKSSYRG